MSSQKQFSNAILVDLVGELHKQGVQFKSITDAIDTGSASGRFFFHVMASLAEMERELTIERTRAGKGTHCHGISTEPTQMGRRHKKQQRVGINYLSAFLNKSV